MLDHFLWSSFAFWRRVLGYFEWCEGFLHFADMLISFEKIRRNTRGSVKFSRSAATVRRKNRFHDSRAANFD